MIRTQIQLTEEQARHLRSIAHREGVSMAEVIRGCIDARLEKESPLASRYQRARAFIGLEDRADTPKDLARRHDRYIEEDLTRRPGDDPDAG